MFDTVFPTAPDTADLERGETWALIQSLRLMGQSVPEAGHLGRLGWAPAHSATNAASEPELTDGEFTVILLV